MSTSRKKREQQIRTAAKEAYKEHRIERVVMGVDGLWGNHWLLKRPSTTMYLAEVVVLYGPRLLVHGDIPDVLFARFSGKYEEILSWVASSELDYLSSKVLTESHKFDAELAKQDLQDMLEECKGEDYEECWKKQIEHVIDLFDLDNTEYGLMNAYDGLAGYEEFSSVGQVVNSDIIWCQEMVRRLLELMRS